VGLAFVPRGQAEGFTGEGADVKITYPGDIFVRTGAKADPIDAWFAHAQDRNEPKAVQRANNERCAALSAEMEVREHGATDYEPPAAPWQPRKGELCHFSDVGTYWSLPMAFMGMDGSKFEATVFKWEMALPSGSCERVEGKGYYKRLAAQGD